MVISEPIKAFRKIAHLYGRQLKQVILYGSWARGETMDESDIDLLVVLGGNIVPGQEIDRNLRDKEML